ncbi:MSHA biogenesis protein MshM [Vibrio sp. HA2012]|uniref:ExeA family protein n=1 Tax=Vibrio sp. HA2012 TaxID=1971595 RepID=UPI000C2BBD6E|nr:AAA family ATPase [Vibrio sp. HA2012]PJC85565.1 MSHA biogenesis protein MshM [Vibrio sp. HA2012]
MYQGFYGFTQAPFALTPNTGLFHGLPPHYEAIQTVISAISMNEGVIKVTGEVGTGKTMVCRMLINQLPESIQLIYLPNPVLSGEELKLAIARELSIENAQPGTVVDQIQHTLLALHAGGKQVVALLDEAQALSDDALETLRLFGNLETEQRKLLQLVLLGQPELDERLAQHHLRQFRQRITFSAGLRPLTQAEVAAYIQHRISASGGKRILFAPDKLKAVWKASRGIPRLINQICHKALLVAFYAQSQTVTSEHLFAAIHDTCDARKPKFKTPVIWGWREV